MMNELWILGGTLITMDENRRIISRGNICVREGRIHAIGNTDQLIPPENPPHSIDAGGKVILPGLVNAHTHADCILMRGGISQDRGLYNWLVNVLDPARLYLTEEEVRISIELYCHEALRSGITAIVDLAGYVREENHLAALSTYQKMGLRVRYAPMFLDQPPLGNRMALDSSTEQSRALPLIETTDQAIARIEKYIQQFHNSADGRVKVWVAPRLGRAMTPEGLRRSVELAREYDTMTTTHCAETKTESLGSNISTVEYLEQSGYLSPRSVLAHCVWVNEQDIAKLAQTETKVAHAPSTNLYLGSGIAPVARMLEAGVCVGLATDNANANDVVNLFTEMRAAALLQKGITGDAAAVTAEEALEMATIQGAGVLGEEKELGSLEAGKRADMILLNLEPTNLTPAHHIPASLVYQALGSEVTTVIVDGKVLMDNRKFTFCTEEDEARLHEQGKQASLRLAARANVDLSRIHEWRSRIFARQKSRP